MKKAWLAVPVAIAMGGCALKAQALGGLADVQVLDRDTGCVLPTYRHRGQTWVAGRPGARYSIVIHNHRAESVLAVTAVDGVNVITCETGAWGESVYVGAPGESYEISGWRKSQSQIADFNFSTAADSYATRTGRPENVGVIGVALFLEKSPPAPILGFSRRLGADAARGDPAGMPLPATAPPALANRNSVAAESEREALSSTAPKLGTGHGTVETSYSREVAFNRQSSTPNEIIRIRYDSFENLVAMGVVDRRHRPSSIPEPFPDSATRQYVPDPPGG